MRPVDQIVGDLVKAQETAKQADAAVVKFKAELQEVHAAVREALGLRD